MDGGGRMRAVSSPMLAVLLLAVIASCQRSASQGTGEPDTGVDGDADGDTDADSDGDGDTDADADSDGDGDSDGDADTETFDQGTDLEATCVRYVDGDVTDPGDGLSWNSALGSLRNGIESAFWAAETAGFCQVWVKAGVYHVFETSEADTVSLMQNVGVYGGFAGGESQLSERDWIANQTVIDGRAGEAGEERVFHVVTGADGAVLDGFVIRLGRALGDYPDNFGGGMYNAGVSPTVRNCRFAYNLAVHGGAVFNYQSSATFLGCSFQDNHATNRGGAIYDGDGSSVVVAGCSFEGNGAGEKGGAICNRNSHAEIHGCTFVGNVCEGGNFIPEPGGGGAIALHFASASLSHCTFEGNVANAPPLAPGTFGGGAIAAFYGEGLNAVDCSFMGNTAFRNGGAVYADGTAMLRRCRFVGNESAVGSGGAVAFAWETGDVEDSVFAGNAAQFGGGGVHADYGSFVTVRGSTFFGNSAGDSGGAFSGYLSALTVVNSVAWNDSPDEIDDAELEYCLVVYSDVQGGFGGTGNIDADPLFADAAGGDLRLQAGSPCIDAAYGQAASTVDVDGLPRADDPEAPNSGLGPPWVDIGAHERQP
jgi:predicted outer membrane repeat protein